MARQTNLLDDIQLRRWIAKAEPVAKSDGGGLTFTLSPSGTAAWVLRYRSGGRRKELTLGNYPDVALAAARKAARTHRAAIDNGLDPAAEKKAEKVRSTLAWTVSKLCDDFRQKKLVAPLSEATIEQRERDIRKTIKPKIGSLEVRKVTPGDIVHMLQTSRRSWVACDRTLTCARQLFAHAIGKRMINANPAVGIDMQALFGKRPPARKRLMLTEDELRKLLPNIDQIIGRENGLTLRILLATCVRTNELVKARKENIDLERGTWWVQPEAVKTRTGFLVPLTPIVANWFRELLALSGDSEWLLPVRSGKRRILRGETHVGNSTLWAAITKAFEKGKLEMRHFTPHDTRSTAKGHMRNMGISREVTEVALNHTLGDMDEIYDVREEIPERRQALELWAQFIAACAEGTAWKWNPVPIMREVA